MRGPYGTNEGDMWLGEGSLVQERLNLEHIQETLGGQDHEGLILIHEMMVKDGELQECIYLTALPELIAQAAAGHEKWLAAQKEEA